MKNFYIFGFQIFFGILPVYFFPQCTPKTLTEIQGWNADIVAEGTGGNAFDKSNYSVDGENYFANIYYSEDFVPLDPYNYDSAQTYGGGLPADGQLTSYSSGMIYQLSDYTQNNAVLLRNTVSNSVTLTLTEPIAAEKLYFAAFSSEGSHIVTVTVTFADNSTQTSSFTALDWYQTSLPSNSIVYGIGRIARGTGSAYSGNNFNEYGNMGIFEYTMSINSANQSKAIQSITFTKPTTSNDAETTAVVAVSACELPLAVGNANSTVFEYYPNPTSDFVNVKSAVKVNRAEIYALTGQKIRNIKLDDAQKMNFSGFEKGTYVVKLFFADGKTDTFKISKK